MKHSVSISLVVCALSLVVHGGLLNKLLGDVNVEINACPQIAIYLKGNPAQDAQPVFQSTNPACPNYVPPSDLVDAAPAVQNDKPSTPIPGLGAPVVNPGTYSAAMQAGALNPQQLPILVNNMPPLVADMAVVDTSGSPVQMPGNPSAPAMPSDPRYNAANPQPPPPRFNSLPPLVADTAEEYPGGSPAPMPANPTAINALPSARYNAASPLPLPTQFDNLPLVDDTAAVNTGDAQTLKPATNPAVVFDSMPALGSTITAKAVSPSIQTAEPEAISMTTPAATPTVKCAPHTPASSQRLSAVTFSAAMAAPAVPANTAAARYSGATPGLAPASARRPIDPAQPPVQQAPGRPISSNAYGAAMASNAAMPTAIVAPEIPSIPMSTANVPTVRASAPAGHFFEQSVDTTVTVTALADLPPNVLHAMRHMGAFEFTS
ncbi:hypothetical protein GGF42_002824 [Coemansia sp. RSA 2424]|nr:hypothetical protein GGF42_002824 [Coemansia sp. RSA 2424]